MKTRAKGPGLITLLAASFAAAAGPGGKVPWSNLALPASQPRSTPKLAARAPAGWRETQRHAQAKELAYRQRRNRRLRG